MASRTKKTVVEIPADRGAISLLTSAGVTPRFIKQGRKLVYDPDIATIWDDNDRQQLAFRVSRWTSARAADSLLRIDRLRRILDAEQKLLWEEAHKKKWIALAVPTAEWGRYPRLGPAANWMELRFDDELIATPDGDVRSAGYGSWYGLPIPGKFEGRSAPKPSAARWRLGNRWQLNAYLSARLHRAKGFFEVLHDRLARPAGVPPETHTTRRIETASKDGSGSIVSWWQVRAVAGYHHLPVDRRREWVRFAPLELLHTGA